LVNIIEIKKMTLPDERYRALKCAEQFMLDLCDPSKTPKVPRSVRERARGILRHYPTKFDIDRIAESAPDVVSNKPWWDHYSDLPAPKAYEENKL
jgi:hypothetical protein